MSEDGNRKLALAHQEIADIFFSENNAADALEHYVLAEKFNAEDFYVEVDVLDSVAACLLLLDKPEEGIQKFKELLEILVKYRKLDSHLYKYVGCQTCEDNEKRIYILSPTERCRTTNKVTSMSRSEMFM